jgi:hypothetical protein
LPRRNIPETIEKTPVPMRILPWLIVYNGLGPDETLDRAASFLMGSPPRMFGSAVKEIELCLKVRTRTTSSPTPVGKQRRDYVESLKVHPQVGFLRRYSKLRVAYVSRLKIERYSIRLLPQNKWVKDKRVARSLASFRAACHEMASHLRLAEAKLKKADDFDWDAFSAHLDKRLSELPKSRMEFQRLVKKLVSPWDHEPDSEDVEPTASDLKRKPKLIAINHDDDRAAHIGRMADGRQFFLTTPFIPADREFVALYLFEPNGKFQKAFIDDLGKREKLDRQKEKEVFEKRLKQLGPIEFGRIRVEPFKIKRFGTEFGLVPLFLADEDGDWTVEAHPGNYMGFFKPWNSGEYDT